MDDTLYDCKKAHTVFLQHLEEMLVRRLRIPRTEVLGYAKDLCKRHQTDSTVMALHRAYGWPLEMVVAETHGRIDLATCITPIPGLREFILNAGTHRALFTNSPDNYMRCVMTYLGVMDCFEHTVSQDDMYTFEKPSPESFACVAALFPPDARFELVDDSLKNITAAHELGWKTTWFQAPWKKMPDVLPRANRIITSLAELTMKSN